jgi:hypothetical protein
MREAWSRRRFLKASVVGVAGVPMVSTITAAISAGCVMRRPGSTAAPAGSAFSSRDRATLVAAMDEIIPVADGMPSASQAGGLDYLERLATDDEGVQNDLRDALGRLNALAQSARKREFAELPSEQRVAILRQLESRTSLAAFGNLRHLVYEAYYTQPAVWKLIGFEFYPPERPGPLPPPFDDAVLARVRQMPKLYREVG